MLKNVARKYKELLTDFLRPSKTIYGLRVNDGVLNRGVCVDTKVAKKQKQDVMISEHTRPDYMRASTMFVCNQPECKGIE